MSAIRTQLRRCVSVLALTAFHRCDDAGMQLDMGSDFNEDAASRTAHHPQLVIIHSNQYKR